MGGGIDLMGQRLIFVFGQIFIIVLALIPAVATAGILIFATQWLFGPAIAVTFALFILVYGIIFSAGIYFINRLIAKGLDAAAADEPAVSLGGALAAAGRSTER